MTVGIDARLQVIDGGLYDLQLANNGDIESADFFDTAILVSLFAERRANESEVFEASMRRGWIGNESTPGFEIGSKIWLYEQSRLTRTSINGMTVAISQALQWFIDSGYAVSIGDIELIVTTTGLDLSFTIRRPNSKVEKRYYTLWDNTAISYEQPQTFFDISATVGMNVHAFAGNPSQVADVIIRVPNNIYPTGTPGIIVGPWHPDSTITIIVDSGVTVAGAGGKGGDGGIDWEGSDSWGGGGGGGASNGLGGDTSYAAADGSSGTDTLGGAGAVGGVGNNGATEDRLPTDGVPGLAAIDSIHDLIIHNSGSILGGAGGGGGGAQHTQTGGDGGSIAAGVGQDGDDGGGLGGARGPAIDTHGNNVTFAITGTVAGSVI